MTPETITTLPEETTGAPDRASPCSGPRGPFDRTGLEWIQVAPGAPCFVTETGRAWTPVGQNDAITWPELEGLFRRRDVAAVDEHLAWLKESGVTCLRLMLEYCHGEHRYIEKPAGTFHPAMVTLWDDLFALCEKHGLRVLLTPFDTFWMWLRWRKHPYNVRNGGPCHDRTRLLTCPETRKAIRNRLAFATERWGGSGALFAWDLWNEIHLAQAGESAEPLAGFIDDLAGFLDGLERRRHGRAHPRTVSVFGPHLDRDALISDAIFRHPALNFASTHFYEEGTIDDPRNTIDPAVSTGRLIREALAQITDRRPFFDSEHGPIHTYKDRHRNLSESFDDEYFRHMQWAHFASGGAGGGMRWPNRRPHTLTAGMREAQRGLSGFLPFIRWPEFRRENWNEEIAVGRADPAGRRPGPAGPGQRVRAAAPEGVVAMGSGDGRQAIVWLLRTGPLNLDGTLRDDLAPATFHVTLPRMEPGRYHVTGWDTRDGRIAGQLECVQSTAGPLTFVAPGVATDLALAVRPAAFGAGAAE